MAHLALIVILDMREVGVQLGGTLVTDGIFHQVEQRFHFLTGVHVPARAAVEMTEVDARQQAVIGSHQLADLLGSAEHALFAHGFQADRAAGQVRLIQRTQDVFYVFVRVAHGAVTGQLALTAAVHDHTRCAKRHSQPRGLQHITDIFLHALALLGREIDEIRRMNAHLNAVLLGCRTDFEGGLLAAAHAASALILKRGQSHLCEPCRRILALLEACGGKRLRVARRTEFRLSHDVLSPPFCAVRAR